jgi:hypothetical protein
MRTAIILFVLAVAAPSVAQAASYERQSDALKACFEQEDSGKCMVDAGWRFCPHCAVFGTMLGGECMTHKNGPYRPACWYWHEDEEPKSATAIMARWQSWVERRGWEKQSAPYGPDEPVIPAPAPAARGTDVLTAPRRMAWEPCFRLEPQSAEPKASPRGWEQQTAPYAPEELVQLDERMAIASRHLAGALAKYARSREATDRKEVYINENP